MAFDPSKHLVKLKGKDYLEVKWRLVWLHEYAEDHGLVPIIETAIHSYGKEEAVVCCTVGLYRYLEGQLVQVREASGIGSETPGDFGDYLEKAETKALGRALGQLGFGTQFAPELDFEDVFGPSPKVVDAPVTPSQGEAREFGFPNPGGN